MLRAAWGTCVRKLGDAIGRNAREHVYVPRIAQEIGSVEPDLEADGLQRIAATVARESRGRRSAGVSAGLDAGSAGREFAAARWLLRLARRASSGPILGRASPTETLMEKFVIEGGVPLSGTMVPAGNKNGALPILAACLLTDEEVLVRNVPRIRDVEAMLAILERDRRARRRALARRPNESSRCAAGQTRRCHDGRGRPRARRADPRLVPARRAAARALSAAP